MPENSASMPASQNDVATLLLKNCISPLDDYGVLEIMGPDSSKFLQGQLTCNMQDISLTQSRLGAHCTHKGRMVASFRLCQLDEQRYLFVLPSATLPALQQSLKKYIVFSKATLRDATAEYRLSGISGPDSQQCIEKSLGTAPALVHEQQKTGDILVIRVGEPARFLVLQSCSSATWPWGSPHTVLADSHYWHWLNIHDGIGEVRQQTVEAFIPQMLNLQLLGGISFTKGCYTGQEIVARMAYRGIQKKAMYRIAGRGTPPLPNTPLNQTDSSAESAVGHIVMAERTTGAQWEALAVLQHDAAAAALRCDGTAEEIRLLSLPYAIPTGDEKR